METISTSAPVSLVERLTGEGLIGLRAACKLYPSGTHPTTPARHCLKGVRVNGRVVRLEHLRIGAKLVTSEAAVKRLFYCTERAG